MIKGERKGERGERGREVGRERGRERGRGGREREGALCISFLSPNVLLKGESN